MNMLPDDVALKLLNTEKQQPSCKIRGRSLCRYTDSMIPVAWLLSVTRSQYLNVVGRDSRKTMRQRGAGCTLCQMSLTREVDGRNSSLTTNRHLTTRRRPAARHQWRHSGHVTGNVTDDVDVYTTRGFDVTLTSRGARTRMIDHYDGKPCMLDGRRLSSCDSSEQRMTE